MNPVKLLHVASASIERNVLELGQHFKSPELVELDGMPVFRHRQQDDLLMSYLKCVRLCSLNNAVLVLLDSGQIYETFILARCIDESVEDIFYLSRARGAGDSPSEDQLQMVREFFQEEFARPNDPLNTNTARNRLKREKIQAAIAADVAAPLNPYDSKQSSKVIHRSFSGYVHGAYPHIMEAYGVSGGVGRYFTRGLAGTPRMGECIDVLLHSFYRGILAARVVAKRCSSPEVDDALLAIANLFDEFLPTFAEDPKVVLRRIKDRARKSKT
ncbi:MAG: hypothetical protein MEQ07_01990 [Aquimonas sp.]|nr:hypothetical protein [Aquimonas sp.]